MEPVGKGRHRGKGVHLASQAGSGSGGQTKLGCAACGRRRGLGAARACLSQAWRCRGCCTPPGASPWRSVRGSVSVMALVTRVTSTSGPMLPSAAACLAGRHTKSSCRREANEEEGGQAAEKGMSKRRFEVDAAVQGTRGWQRGSQADPRRYAVDAGGRAAATAGPSDGSVTCVCRSCPPVRGLTAIGHEHVGRHRAGCKVQGSRAGRSMMQSEPCCHRSALALINPLGMLPRKLQPSQLAAGLALTCRLAGGLK